MLKPDLEQVGVFLETLVPVHVHVCLYRLINNYQLRHGNPCTEGRVYRESAIHPTQLGWGPWLTIFGLPTYARTVGHAQK